MPRTMPPVTTVIARLKAEGYTVRRSTRPGGNEPVLGLRSPRGIWLGVPLAADGRNWGEGNWLSLGTSEDLERAVVHDGDGLTVWEDAYGEAFAVLWRAMGWSDDDDTGLTADSRISGIPVADFPAPGSA